MTKDEALKLALEALEEAHYKIEHKQDAKKREKAITAIKEALAQPDYKSTSDYQFMENVQGELELIKLVQTGVGIEQRAEEAYEAAKQRSWVGVSDEAAQPEPVACECDSPAWCKQYKRCNRTMLGLMPYVAQRTWVEIDGDDWIKALELADFDKVAAFEFFEAKLKELNT